jgi:hypothetical protein
MARSTSTRIHLAPRNSSFLFDATKNPDLDRTPLEVADRLKINWVPSLEPVYDSRGHKLEGLNNIVTPEGRSLGTSGDRFKPLGMPALAGIAESLMEAVPSARMIAGWQVDGGAKYGYRLSVGKTVNVANRNDLIACFIDLVGGSDGRTTWAIQGSVLRLVCTNGMTNSETLVSTFGRHTTNAEIKLNHAMVQSVFEIIAKGGDLVNNITDLAGKPMSEMDIQKFFKAYAAKIEPKNEARAKQMVDDLSTLMGSETQMAALSNGQATAYTVYNAITELSTYGSSRDYRTAFLRQLGGNHIESNKVAYELLMGV